MGMAYRFLVFAVLGAGLVSFSLTAQTPPPADQASPAPASTTDATGPGTGQVQGENTANTDIKVPAGQEFLVPGLDAAMARARLEGPDAQFSPPLMDLLSQESQARDFVRSIYHRSFILGGLGYLGQEEYGLGALFGGLDLAVIAGTLIGAHALLPSQVQIQNLDYFATPCKDLETAWSSLSLADLLPALAVLAGGSAARLALLSLEADGARKSAAQKIRAGTLRFTPRPWMALDSSGGLWLGMRFSGP